MINTPDLNALLETYRLNPDNKLLRQVLGEYRRLVVEKELAERFEKNRVATEIARGLKHDGVIKQIQTRRRKAIARDITARMTSVAEGMLGL